MPHSSSESISLRSKISALVSVARFKPRFTSGIIGLGLVAAVLEGIGLSFILPIIELVQVKNPGAESEGLMGLFVSVYQMLGVPLTLGTVVLGVTGVMVIRYTTSFTVAWLREVLRTIYIRDLQERAFQHALDARVEYFDKEGSDDILNAIITQTYYAGRVIQRAVQFIEQLFLAGIYFFIALVIAPALTLLTAVSLGGFTLIIRRVLESGYETGDKIAEANEQRQQAAQAGTQGIRDIRIFGIADELFDNFVEAIEKYTRARIILRRNEAAISKFYNLVVAVSVFVLIYLALTFANLSLGSLGVFLFAMFRLGPRISNVNRQLYQVENDLPHLVRTQSFIEELRDHEEPGHASQDVPDEVTQIEFDDVWFGYDDDFVLQGVNFAVRKGEFVGFVGQSGAGKSTIVSLLARLYKVDEGEIRANTIPIESMDIDAWREKLSVVRQNPYIFNDTLRYNLTIGNRDVGESDLNRVCEIAKVDEFLEDLPDGYDTQVGDDGVRLSGGQKQRVALARALLKDADVLVLDEATSDLDSSLEKQVQESIETMDRNYAIIAIAHRLSTVQNADRIYTVEDGHITEAGEHSELLENSGTYAELYSIQSSG